MAYLAIKKVKGRYYGYMQESYREGGSVKTRTVEYLGAIEPAIAQQVQATRQQLGAADMAALVKWAPALTPISNRLPLGKPLKRNGTIILDRSVSGVNTGLQIGT